MLTAKALGYALPEGRALFQNLNFTIEKKKYGLVGINGVGKSTLVKIISGALEPSSGQLIGGARGVYLPQWEDRPEITAGEYLVDIWEGAEAILRESLLKDLDLAKPLAVLSGGQWMRVRLLRVLAHAGDLLILDEPTNDLDRESRESLYQFVQTYTGGLLVISHDRELLEDVDEIWELSNQGLAVYGGSFSFYEERKGEERTLLTEKIDTARREKKKQEREHVEKLDRQAKRTRLAEKKAADMGLPKIILGGRKRQAQVTVGKIQSAEQERDQQRAAEFQQLLEKQKQSSEIRLDFSLGTKPKGKVIFSLENFNCRYVGQESMLWQEPLTFTLYAGDRLNIRGSNGSGKSTLLKIVTGVLASEKCERFGLISEILRKYVYLDQNYSLLDNKQNVMESLLEDCRYDQTETRNRLADYGFTGDSVFKPISVLSGGERLRLCLAKLAFSLKAPEVWILDEPTNNLDLDSLAVLEAALREYDGTLIVVSHDERFIERISCGQSLQLVSAQKDRSDL